ncbi:hypothetical protein GMJAKD_08720 [Candidatus Electrothrix aarhusensis]
MHRILQELEGIRRRYYLCGNYRRTYETLGKLCCDNPECKDFLDEADHILSRYNRIQRKVNSGRLGLSEATTEENKISYSYEQLIGKMKNFFNEDFEKEKKSYYEKSILYTKNKCIELRDVRRAMEKEFEFCKNDDKKNIMMGILRHINDIIIHLLDMISNFTAAQDYE